MRNVTLDGVGPVSALGFGCASLGSRVSAATGRAAIERALAAGVTWFDVAPSYGDGGAEKILGEALRGANVAVVTKVGLVAPRRNIAKRAIGSIARPLVAAIPALRPLVKRLRPDGAQRVALDGETVRISLFQSLERLGRDSVAVLALHEPSLDDVRNPDVIAALTDLRDQGLAARIGVAGSPDVIAAARAAGLPVDVAQVANSPFARNLTALKGAPAFTVTHSVFGVAGALDALKRVARQKPEAIKALDTDDLPALLLDYAFAVNPEGVVITSNYAAGHLAANAAVASRAPDVSLVAKVDALIGAP
ncbi:hypothetical protein sos41_30290 [Alphaproteobacteria bacterium SO-S41]|nr:hypothetical protein sos41_30290 [Alphaproteobacteria bacterium SO-S41]